MLSLFPLQHAQHNPEHEIFRGERVPCFETPARGDYALDIRLENGARALALQLGHTQYLTSPEVFWGRDSIISAPRLIFFENIPNRIIALVRLARSEGA